MTKTAQRHHLTSKTRFHRKHLWSSVTDLLLIPS
ncbi:Uncharacterised protein [Vibrio cholerae]|nr:Uncharacterised protein [Vibrio cholerae]CSI51086.1 Uncharacterised protein [Vibrio cholerae]